MFNFQGKERTQNISSTVKTYKLPIFSDFLFLQEGPDYVRVFVNILRNINKDDTVEYVLALIDEMLTGN